MTLVEEIKKLKKRGYVGLDKHTVKVYKAILFYAETFDMEINYARLQYDREFNLNCREAEESKQDLWIYLSSKFMIQEERYLIKPPNKLKNKKERQDWIKKELSPYYYERHFNNYANPIIYAFSKGKVKNTKGAYKTLETTKKRSNAKKERVIKKRNEYLASGKFTRGKERGMNTIIAKVLKYNYNYGQDVLKLQRRNENPKC